jgi:hypothetical protein
VRRHLHDPDGDGPWFDTAAPLAILTWVVGSVALGVAVREPG